MLSLTSASSPSSRTRLTAPASTSQSLLNQSCSPSGSIGLRSRSSTSSPSVDPERATAVSPSDRAVDEEERCAQHSDQAPLYGRVANRPLALELPEKSPDRRLLTFHLRQVETRGFAEVGMRTDVQASPMVTKPIISAKKSPPSTPMEPDIDASAA